GIESGDAIGGREKTVVGAFHKCGYSIGGSARGRWRHWQYRSAAVSGRRRLIGPITIAPTRIVRRQRRRERAAIQQQGGWHRAAGIVKVYVLVTRGAKTEPGIDVLRSRQGRVDPVSHAV